jgi:membrane protein YqaA with SNARE-associated domain
MQFLTLVAIGFVGTVFWPANPETATLICVAEHLLPLAVAGLATTIGQTAAVLVLYLFGDRLRRRWGGFDRWCTRMRTRHAKRLASGRVALAITSCLLGLPPVSITAALAAGLDMPLWTFVPIVFAGRMVRFTTLAALGAAVASAAGSWVGAGTVGR